MLLKKMISWSLAVLLSFFVVNVLLLFYERPVGWIDTPYGASPAIRKPDSILVHGTEGYGITKIDDNGYTNPNMPLSSDYILIMGASHTQGKEIPSDCKYSVLINDALSGEKNELIAFNIACDGNFLPSIINHFPAAVEMYPNAKYIMIEIGSTDFSIDELQNAINFPEYVDTRTAKQLFSQLSIISKVKNAIKESFPFLSIMKTHLETLSKVNDSSENASFNVDKNIYIKTIEDALRSIRRYYDGKIVFLYHPATVLQKDGSLKIQRSQTIKEFEQACNEVNIDFIDVGDKFQEYYSEYYELPYGFSNTTPGNGHMNKIGHQIMAQAVLEYLEKQS